VFHYKRGLIQLFVSAGVPEPAVTRYRDDMKYVIARSVIADLDDRGAAGRRVQWQIVESMLGLTGPADREADPEAARAALTALREGVGQRAGAGAGNDDAAEARSRKRRADLERQARERQSAAIADLRNQFVDLEQERDAKKRGFAFERFLGDLFRAFNIEYRGSYRVGMEQIDGAFHHGGRDYLVEARWRRLPPDTNDLFDFAMKVSGKLDGTLGLIITMVPPSQAILDHVSRQTRRVLVMDGADLAAVFEGRVTLPEALDIKSRRAAQEGVLFAPLGTQR
jgi:hypothetical protein